MSKKSTGKLAAKLIEMQRDMDNILDYITAHGPTRKEELEKVCNLSTKVSSNRVKKLQLQGLIKSIRWGSYGAAWALGKQEKFKKQFMRRSPRRADRETTDTYRDFNELPANIQKMFGMVPGLEIPEGRHIEESMPDIPIHKIKYGVSGCSLGDL